MNKLTGAEILKIISDNYTEEEFAYNMWTNRSKKPSEDTYVESNDLRKAKIWSEETRKAFIEHPGYRDYKNRDESFETARVNFTIASGQAVKLANEESLNFLGLGSVEEVAQYGGESQGSTWYSVKYFKDHDVYIRINGYYESYNGTEFHNGYGKEVTPKQKTITIYED